MITDDWMDNWMTWLNDQWINGWMNEINVIGHWIWKGDCDVDLHSAQLSNSWHPNQYYFLSFISFQTFQLSIIEYLEETHPTPSLLPKDPFKKSQARTLSLIIGADIQPVQVALYFFQFQFEGHYLVWLGYSFLGKG